MSDTFTGDLEIPFRAALPKGDAYYEFNISVEYEFTPAFRGSHDEPPHGGEVEIISVRFKRYDRQRWRTLPARAFDAVALADRIYDDHEDDHGAYLDYRYEQWREERDERRAAE